MGVKTCCDPFSKRPFHLLRNVDVFCVRVLYLSAQVNVHLVHTAQRSRIQPSINLASRTAAVSLQLPQFIGCRIGPKTTGCQSIGCNT